MWSKERCIVNVSENNKYSKKQKQRVYEKYLSCFFSPIRHKMQSKVGKNLKSPEAIFSHAVVNKWLLNGKNSGREKNGNGNVFAFNKTETHLLLYNVIRICCD